jgi:hypothetical protein
VTLRVVLIALALAAVLLSGCGDDEPERSGATPAQALAEIEKLRTSLDAALATYGTGDPANAERLIAEAHHEHFAPAQGALEEANRELADRLDKAIGQELRQKIKANAPKAEVTALAARIRTDLDRAGAVLRAIPAA